MTIRPYTAVNKDSCITAFKSNVPLFFTEDETPDFERFLDCLQINEAGSGSNRTKYYVVEHGNRVVGCGGFGDKDNTSVLTLAWGLIHKDFHKRGLGKALLLYRLEQIKNHFPDAPVYIDTTQHSFGFFEHHGFRTTKITNNFYAAGMHRYDMVFENR